MLVKYKISKDQIKCVCQTCKSEVKFREQCFLCGEINWSDETLDRLESTRDVEGEMMTVTYSAHFGPHWGIRSDPYPIDNRVTFGVYPTSFRFM